MNCANGDGGQGIIHQHKHLSSHNLLKLPVGDDSNVLNRGFYDELLHIVGLEERKVGSKRIITRCCPGNRNKGSLIENTITHIRHIGAFNSKTIIEEYGNSLETREFNIALELCLSWINRILFLKLLESQLLAYNRGDKSFQFLNEEMVRDFSDLSDLFFLVLAVRPENRDSSIQQKYCKVPYLNSSLFESTELEETFRINLLNNNLEIPVFKQSILKHGDTRRISGSRKCLSYLFDFLDAYDFGSAGNGVSQIGGKTLINASVLGLIFEKINGYRDGSIYTPGYITMFMSRIAIEKTVIEAFRKKFPNWVLNDLDDLKNHVTDRSKKSILAMNNIIDDLRICDPAVGSGHFLVSCLNELVALKSRIGILADRNGKVLSEFVVEVENDELVILDSATMESFKYQVGESGVSPKLQFAQQTLFHEKEKLIENCLFGVDINTNSVRICQLRLWMELLKSAYYKEGKPGELETLPSIDINIKCGNSLLSRFALDSALTTALRGAGLKVGEYRSLVNEYKTTRDTQIKSEIQNRISTIKGMFQESSLILVEKKIETEISALEETKGQLTFSSMESDLKGNKSKKLADIGKKINDLENRREKLLKHKVFQSAFEWRYEFPEILDESGKFLGFDIIITNPPYMRIQEIEKKQPEQKNFYKQNFPRTATKSFDLANLFFELALVLSKPDGNNIFIFPHKLFNSDNGSSLRDYLLNSRSIKQLFHFGANQIFDSATTYPCIALFNKQQSESFKFRKFGLGDRIQNEIWTDTGICSINYGQLERAISHYGENQCIFFSDPSEHDLLDKCYSTNYRVMDAFEDAYQEIATSKDSLYFCKKLEETKDKFKILVNPENRTETPPIESKEFWVEKKFFKPLMLGRDLHRYCAVNSDRLVFFPYSVENGGELVCGDTLKSKYPLTHAFASHYSNVFKSRERNRGAGLEEYYAYIYPKNLTKFQQKKLISMEICTNHPNMTLDTVSMYHNTTVQGLVLKPDVKQDYRYFLGILNSKLFWWFLKHSGDTLQGDARRIFKNFIFPFPLPGKVSEKDEGKIVKPVDKLLRNYESDGDLREREALENEINSEVYGLYGLTEPEIRRIEMAGN